MYECHKTISIVLCTELQQRGTLPQPLRCVLHRHASNPHGNENGNSHAAIIQRCATRDPKTPSNYARTNASKAASAHHYSAGIKKHQTDRSRNRPQPQLTAAAPATHTWAFLHCRMQPLSPKNTFWWPGFLPKKRQQSCNNYNSFSSARISNLHVSTHMGTQHTTIYNNHAAIPLRSATTDSKTPQDYTHLNRNNFANSDVECPSRAKDTKH